MSYIKAESVLPDTLIREIQNYVDGVYIYIPRKEGSRRMWGACTSYRAELIERNSRIRGDSAAGLGVAQLARKYHLSEKSIRRILRDE